MLLTFIGAIVLAIGCVGMVSLAFRATGRKTPKGVLPLTAGVAMIAFIAYIENSWYSRIVADLPESHVVVATGEPFSNFIQPWTLIFPRINRFMLVDTATVRVNQADSSLRLAEVILVQRYARTIVTRQVIDCENARRADLTDDIALDEDGLPQIETWIDVPADGELLGTVCNAPVTGVETGAGTNPS
ncbi:MAG: hypothetical protein JJ926_10460 [Roseitalea sp.]|nr:hypothetical protein [Roseitalea sp.]MBO6952293.1 hypothetical protein [Rhizobiaceae bacterium]MBO6591861.1 hypothetical protein [Roseitalea sp.]MBO6598116.1 hypothetical protein [Roseitalea sp.]MBO6610562.1 hypothetical protein [Roseitalea sp.]